MDIDRNITDKSGATVKNLRPDVVVRINGVLVFKAEEKQYSSEMEKAEKELSDKTESWNASMYGKIPYILSYAAAQNNLRFSAITEKGRIPISELYDSFMGEFMVILAVYTYTTLIK